MLRHTAFWLALLMIASAAAADTTADCVQDTDQDLRVRGCSEIIQRERMSWAYHNRGNAYSEKKNFDRAIADYGKAAELDSRNPWIYQQRGLAYEMKGEKEKAIADFRMTLSLDPSLQRAKEGLSRLTSTSADDVAAKKRADAKPLPKAQSGSVKEIFEKYNLLGVFAWDCSKPASKGNLYYVNRLLDADRVQREQMEGPTTRSWFAIIDKAAETGPNEIRLSGHTTGTVGGKSISAQPADGTWRIEQGRVLAWEATLSEQKLVAGGKILATGQQMPWLNKCSGP